MKAMVICSTKLSLWAECTRELYARYLCSRDALGLKAADQARRATIGYLVYKRASKGILHKIICQSRVQQFLFMYGRILKSHLIV